MEQKPVVFSASAQIKVQGFDASIDSDRAARILGQALGEALSASVRTGVPPDISVAATEG